MDSNVAFVICTERGALERKSILLVRSLRRFGGRLKDAPVYSYAPRAGRDVTPATRRWFARHGVEHRSEVLNTRYVVKGVHNKAFVVGHAERTLDHEILVFADSDQIVVAEPSLLLLPPDRDAAACPVGIKGCGPSDPDDPDHDYWWRLYGGRTENIGTSGPDDPEYGFWMKLYEMCGIAGPDYVETTVDQQRIFSYWNSGLVAVRRDRGLFSRWHDVFVEAMGRGLIPGYGDFYMDQAALAAAFRAADARVHILPHSYNYHANLQGSFRHAAREIGRIEDLVTIHYHSMFDRPGPTNPLAVLAADPRTRAELDGMIRRSGVWPPRRGWIGGYLEPLRRFRRALAGRLRPRSAPSAR
jgi:hypothetical protein